MPPDGAEWFCIALAETYRECSKRLRVIHHPGVTHRFVDIMQSAVMDWFDHHLKGVDGTARLAHHLPWKGLAGWKSGGIGC